jgi:hypothetical protein
MEDFKAMIDNANNLTDLLRIKRKILVKYIIIDVSPFGTPLLYSPDPIAYHYFSIIDNKINEVIKNTITLN